MTTIKYITFYEATSPFSNFYPLKTPITVNGNVFSSSEQLYMYEKARYFKDEKTADLILFSKTPMDAKILGRKVRGFSEKEWKKVREKIMYSVLLKKFSCNDKLRSTLMGTSDTVLVEASPKDAIWGVGVGSVLASNPKNWKGLNLLGYTLMKVRDYLNGLN